MTVPRRLAVERAGRARSRVNSDEDGGRPAVHARINVNAIRYIGSNDHRDINGARETPGETGQIRSTSKKRRDSSPREARQPVSTSARISRSISERTGLRTASQKQPTHRGARLIFRGGKCNIHASVSISTGIHPWPHAGPPTTSSAGKDAFVESSR